MISQARFRANRPKVILETFDNEAVIVHLDSGNYYSLDNTGVEIWGLLEKGLAVTEVIDAITCRYQTERCKVEYAVNKFVNELVREHLLAELPQDAPHPDSSVNYNVPYGPDQRKFSAPVLEKFTDMQELLLLDPIHEVDATGWPHAATDQVETQARKVG